MCYISIHTSKYFNALYIALSYRIVILAASFYAGSTEPTVMFFKDSDSHHRHREISLLIYR